MRLGPATRLTLPYSGVSNWHARYLGSPYRKGGYTRRNGIDCYGLVRSAYAWQLGILLPRMGEKPANENWQELRENWKEVSRDSIRPFDVVLFRAFGSPSHIGIALDSERFLHSSPAIGVCLHRLDSAQWHHKIIRVYRNRSME